MKNIIISILSLFLIQCALPDAKTKEGDSYLRFIDSVDKAAQQKTQPQPQSKTTINLAELEDSLVIEYKKMWENVKLDKSEGLPQYQSYLDTLDNILEDINDISKQSNGKLVKLEKLRLKLVDSKKYDEALKNYTIYGQLLYSDELRPACETALQNSLNDPGSLDIIDYSLKGQSKKGWIVSLKYRAKNGFGALVLNQSTFTVQYDLINKLWVVVDIK